MGTMAASGAVSLQTLQTTVGGNSPISFNEYYRGGVYLPNNATNANVPVSGQISASQWLGCASAPRVPSFTSNFWTLAGNEYATAAFYGGAFTAGTYSGFAGNIQNPAPLPTSGIISPSTFSSPGGTRTIVATLWNTSGVLLVLATDTPNTSASFTQLVIATTTGGGTTTSATLLRSAASSYSQYIGGDSIWFWSSANSLSTLAGGSATLTFT